MSAKTSQIELKTRSSDEGDFAYRIVSSKIERKSIELISRIVAVSPLFPSVALIDFKNAPTVATSVPS